MLKHVKKQLSPCLEPDSNSGLQNPIRMQEAGLKNRHLCPSCDLLPTEQQAGGFPAVHFPPAWLSKDQCSFSEEQQYGKMGQCLANYCLPHVNVSSKQQRHNIRGSTRQRIKLAVCTSLPSGFGRRLAERKSNNRAHEYITCVIFSLHNLKIARKSPKIMTFVIFNTR